MSGTPVRNDKGEWVLPATRRPDGTWRKEIRVKEGYVPPDEAAAYVPAGARAVKSRGIPGMPVGAPASAAPQAKQPKPTKKAGTEAGAGGQGDDLAGKLETVLTLAASAASAPAVVDADPGKVLKRLEKKMREIEELENKPREGLNPEQIEKLSKKVNIEEEIRALKAEHNLG